MILPHENAILAYITLHPACTMVECSRALGIGLAAVLAAATSLEAKGVIDLERPREPVGTGNGRGKR